MKKYRMWLLLFIILGGAYLAIWLGISFINFELVESDNYAIRAAQYLHLGIWGLSWALSPLYVIYWPMALWTRWENEKNSKS